MFDQTSVLPIREGEASADERRSVLVVSSDANRLRERLRVEGYQIFAAARGERAIDAVSQARIDCLIFDLSASGRHGFDVCRELRARGSNIPIVFLTRRNRPMDGVIGLRLGADDYVRKPVELEELLARLEAVLRRSNARTSPPAPEHVYALRGIRVDFRTAEVVRGGRPVCLSALELHLLRYLIEHRGEVVTRDQLLEHVWGYGALPVTRTVDVRIASLRRKLEADPARPALILTIHGVGYKLVT